MPAYNYEDENGDVLYRVVRYGEKNFRQEHPDNNNGGWEKGRDVPNDKPYHLTEVLAGIDSGKPIWIFEGEKDVETARLQDLIATCNSGGAGKWNDDISNWLRGAEPVLICWDNDPEGRRHALQVEESLRRAGVVDIRFRRAVVGKDFTDHVTAGKTVEQLARKKPKQRLVDGEESDPAEAVDDQLPAAFQLALTKLNKVTAEYGKPNQYNALCPAHDDTNPSLSIRPGENVAVLVKCHAADCEPEAIARALGIAPVEFTAMPARKLDKQDSFNELAYMRKKANEHADQRLMQERSQSTVEFGEREESFVEELQVELVPTKWLIDSWFKTSTAVLLNADPKAGKTRVALNLAKSLSENEPFLGRFQTSLPAESRVWYGNWDQPADLMREYLHDYKWLAPERLIMQHLAAMEFPFWVPSVFDDFAQYARRMHIGLMIVDTLHVAAQGFVTDENDNNEMSAFVHLLRSLCAAAEIPNLLVIHHTGHSTAQRGRGASTLAADFDGMWFLHVEDSEQFDSPRQLSAKGRKLGVSPISLVYSLDSECYTYRGGMPAKSGADQVDPDKLKECYVFATQVKDHYLVSGEWPKMTEARKYVRKKTSQISPFIKTCVALGIVTRVDCGDYDEIRVPGTRRP